MSLKFVGAILIVSACGCCGFMIAASYVSKIRLFQNLIQVLDYMVCELQYRATSLPKLCRQASEHCKGKLREIVVGLAEELDAQVSPNVSFCMESILEKIGNMDTAIADILIDLGKQLGRFDLSGQISGLEKCRNQCIDELAKLNKNNENRMRSYQTLGLCAGAAIAILFV